VTALANYCWHALSTTNKRPALATKRGAGCFFLHTDDFWRDFQLYKAKGLAFVRDPKEENYGTVAVFRDLYGNLWDLLEPTT
jgi:hypothetical protein